MQSGWRLYAVMIGLAALTGTVVALALSGGPRLPSESPRRGSASPTASPSPSRSPNGRSSPSASVSPTATATSGASSDPLERIRPLATTWRPNGTVAVAERRTASGSQLVAVPLDGSAPTPLLDLPSGAQWALRLDGSALAFTVEVGSSALPRTRIAVLNFQTGTVAWVTPDEPFSPQRSPWWSNDGNVVYYTRTSFDGANDFGIYRIRADGTNLTQLRGPSSDGAIAVVGITPDGLGLVLQRTNTSGVVDVFDLGSRTIRSLVSPPLTTGARPSGIVDAWRPQRPRALVRSGGPAGGLSLYVWDDLAPPPSPTPLPNAIALGADWDPTASRIVAALVGASGSGSTLVTMDASGQNRVTLTGTDGAFSPYWLRAGVIYLYAPQQPGREATEVRIAQPSGTAAPKTLYSDRQIVRLTFVSP